MSQEISVDTDSPSAFTFSVNAAVAAEETGRLSTKGMRVSLRRVLSIHTLLIVGSVTGGISLAALYQLSNHLSEKSSQSCQRVAVTTARAIERAIVTGQHADARRLVNHLITSDEQIVDVSVIDQNGTPLFRRQSDRMAEGATVQSNAEMFDDEGLSIGQVHVGVSTAADKELEIYAGAILLLIACLVGAVCFVSTIWLARKIIGPVERLIEGANELSNCNFDLRLAPTRQRELSMLVGAFNSLARKLAESTVSQNYVNSIIESMSEGLAILDDQLMIENANPAFYGLTDYEDNQVIGANILGFLSDNEGATVEFKAGGAFVAKQLSREFLLRSADGTMIPVSVSCASRSDASGENVGYVLVFKDVREHKLAQEELQRLASLDPLTGALNRRSFLKRAENEVNFADDQPISAVMADIDYFKRVNDVHGHLAGDEILKNLSRLLLKEAGDEALVCRYGGEEFCIVLPGYTESQAVQWAESVRQKFESQVHHGSGRPLKATCTFGIASSRHMDSHALTDLVVQADDTLNQAKRQGRNRVAVPEDVAAPDQLPQTGMTAADVMEVAPQSLDSTCIAEVLDRYTKEHFETLLIVDDKGNYRGCVGPLNLIGSEQLDPATPIGSLAEDIAPLVDCDEDTARLADIMQRYHSRFVVVRASNSSTVRPLGIVMHQTVMLCSRKEPVALSPQPL